MSKLKVGITCRSDASIFSSGLDQNIFFLHDMLSDMGYEAVLISESPLSKMVFDKPVTQITLKTVKEYDIILEVAHPLSVNLTQSYNSAGKPLIGIKYGNSFMTDIEKLIDKGVTTADQQLGINLPFRNREIWISEQYLRFKDYIEVLTRANVKVIPYIWDSSILRASDDGFHMGKMFVPRDGFKKIAIVEPNLNLTKNSMVPLAICEMAYDKRKDLIKEVLCFGSKHFEKNSVFSGFINILNIHKNKVASYEARYPIHKVFSKDYANTIVSTQLFNEQNYVYMEALFYKRLLVHNSPMFKDVGYYYEDYNVNMGSDALLEAIESFDQEKHSDSYETKIESMSIYNLSNQEKTRELIESVI